MIPSDDALILKLTIKATPPVVTTGDATGSSATKATLNGVLTDDGGAATTANVYYGSSDGGTNPAAWDNVSSLPVTLKGILGLIY